MASGQVCWKKIAGVILFAYAMVVGQQLLCIKLKGTNIVFALVCKFGVTQSFIEVLIPPSSSASAPSQEENFGGAQYLHMMTTSNALVKKEPDGTPRNGELPYEAVAPQRATEAGEQKKSTVQAPWERLQREVAKYDDEMVKNWKDDINTVLVFAGLFSAIFTAFVIESYSWLSERVQYGQSSFKADSSSIRINCFWFFSLMFSLPAALLGLLCRQWLRGHQRDARTSTPAEELVLRRLLGDSLEKYDVSLFLSALSVLLEVTLLAALFRRCPGPL
uniref:DUF6535 domain-containing protein n=1 Tax=Moniliophthora roreri TaxID=221103 RepID=A0A0W0FT88_MONRR